MDLTYKGNLDKLIAAQNICDLLPDEDIATIGKSCSDGYTIDKASRAQWEAWYAEAMKLALQVKEAKSFPWPGASNIKFPLITIAALNFHAKAYPAIVNGESVVKCRSLGKDPDGEKNKRAIRVGKHMSYQLLECSEWEEQTDRGLLVISIMGCGFKKTIRDNNRRVNCSDFVMPQDLVVNYYTTDLETCPRASHRFTLTKNELREHINAKLYRDPAETATTAAPPMGPLEAAKDRAQKLSPPAPDKSVNFLVEQSCFMDLDDDGYDEPYAVTFDEQSGFVYRIIARYYKTDVKYDGKKVLRIEAENYYTKIPFIPSPDGGFYDVGLGLLLGPLAESCSTLINQITDWATMSITAGGFLGRGVRMKAGDTTFKPLEWKTVDSTGDDLHKNIVQLPIKDLSPVLLELLKFLVNYGERIAGSGDIQVGELPGQNVKAGTMEIANENGRLIFNSIFKRIWRSLKAEFKKIYRLNQLFQQDDEFTFGEMHFEIKKSDYGYPDSGIVPAADPNIVSKTERRAQADMVLQRGVSLPGFNMPLIITRWLEAWDVPGVETIYDLEKFPAGPSAEMEELKIKASLAETKKLQATHAAQIAAGELMNDIRESQARILKLTAEALLAAKKAEGVDRGHEIALLNAAIGAEQNRQDRLVYFAEIMMDSMKDGYEPRVRRVEKSSGDKKVLPIPLALPADGNGGVVA